MPTNPKMEFLLAQQKYEKAKTLEERLEALIEMQKYAPDHKGAENLRKEISRRIKQIREKLEKQRESAKAKGRSIGIKKEGIAQIVLLGMPNSGKSTLLKALTGVDVKIADYAFTTIEPEIGMMNYKGAKIQIVELPGIIEGSSQGKARGTEWLSIARNADAIAIVVDANEFEKELKILGNELKKSNIVLNREKPKIKIKKSEFSGIEIAGERFLKIPKKEVERFLRERGYYHISVVFLEESGLKELEEALNKSLVYKKAIIIAVDKIGNAKIPEKIGKTRCILIKDLNEKTIDTLKEELFSLLNVVLVYTKKPREEAEKEPIAMPKGSSVKDLAKRLHKEIYKKLKYAKLYKEGTKSIPKKVSKDYILENGDIIELVF